MVNSVLAALTLFSFRRFPFMSVAAATF